MDNGNLDGRTRPWPDRSTERPLISPSIRAARYLRRWARPLPGVPDEIDLGQGQTADAYGDWSRRRAPAWIVLHGVTVAGGAHPSLVRFAGALADTGATVLVPQVDSWRALDLDPSPGHRAISAAVDYIRTIRPDARCGLVGFSFGCQPAIMAASAPANRETVAGVVGFGGYGDLESTILFGLTGEYEYGGTVGRIRPDPYGRWIVAANYLARIPGLEDAEDVCDALRSLATLAGQRRIMSWDPAHDPVKDELEERIHRDRRGLFRLFAPPADQEPDQSEARVIAPKLAEAARRTHPLLEGLDTDGLSLPPVHLFHGRHDQLIPWVETLRLAEGLEGRCTVRKTVTGLFAHSQEERSGLPNLPEFLRFYLELRRVLAIPHPGRMS
ncbi:MAG: hypothetical protein HKO53_05685 [Gemmatimonadetes bacterium]|nr:hypothetical protein [Gemmatimonadota bacterium]